MKIVFTARKVKMCLSLGTQIFKTSLLKDNSEKAKKEKWRQSGIMLRKFKATIAERAEVRIFLSQQYLCSFQSFKKFENCLLVLHIRWVWHHLSFTFSNNSNYIFWGENNFQDQDYFACEWLIRRDSKCYEVV